VFCKEDVAHTQRINVETALPVSSSVTSRQPTIFEHKGSAKPVINAQSSLWWCLPRTWYSEFSPRVREDGPNCGWPG